MVSSEQKIREDRGSYTWRRGGGRGRNEIRVDGRRAARGDNGNVNEKRITRQGCS